MAQIWNPTNTQAHDTVVQVDVTSGLVTPQVARPTGPTIALDLLSTKVTSTGTLTGGIYLVSNSSWCHFDFSDNVTVSNGMFAAGERTIVVPDGQYLSVIKASGQSDGVIRLTLCE